MKTVLVTGATGFVGTTLCGVLARSGYRVRAALRSDRPLPGDITDKAVVGDIGATTDWGAALRDVKYVVHVAARAHVMRDVAAHSAAYYATNERGTERLANAAAAAGVRRFIYLSSVKVNDEENAARAYSGTDEPRPRDEYGRSKWLGEQRLQEAAARSRMEPVIVRSPLVYGPGVRANFLRLMHWVDQEWPLPLGAIRNSRSLVSIWNLCDLLRELLINPRAAGRVWMVSDGEDLSTPDLIRRIGSAMGRRVRLYPVPVSLLRLAGGAIGRGPEVARLCGDLRIDLTPTRRDLGWSPQTSIDDALARTVAWYLAHARNSTAAARA